VQHEYRTSPGEKKTKETKRNGAWAGHYIIITVIKRIIIIIIIKQINKREILTIGEILVIVPSAKF